MAAELFVRFKDKKWLSGHLKELLIQLKDLNSFVLNKENEFWLKGDKNLKDEWPFDVRLFIKEDHIFMEISSHPPTIEKSLKSFLNWIRMQTEILIEDEDGEQSGW